MKQEIVDQFIEIVGPAACLQDTHSLQTYGRDWTKEHTVDASCVLLPKSVSQIADIMRLCTKLKIAVVPSGGRTGLAAAAVATQGEIVLSLEKMNKILNVDTIGATIEVEAGVLTQNVQDAARDAGLFFSLDLAAKGSCQIGGNIATNAGGTKLIRYGGMREQVLGLEVVLASGEILNLNSRLRKNNVGYDLKHLLIGSEGTLGVISKATLKLMPQPSDLSLMLMGVSDFEKISKLLGLCGQQGVIPTAFEFFTQEALDLVTQFHPSLSCPLENNSSFYVLLEIENISNQAQEIFERFCEAAFEQELVDDATVAGNSQQFHELWALRENISESISQSGHVRKNDISVPVDLLEQFVPKVEAIFDGTNPVVQVILFGHIGDGNIHLNYVGAKTIDIAAFNLQVDQLEAQVFKLLPAFQGSISAEHGIGLLKKDKLSVCVSPLQLALMKSIKKVFDPDHILNPGKIFDV